MKNFLTFLLLFVSCFLYAQRTTMSLNGIWQIEESVLPDAMPEKFGHKVPVPGLANLAEPAFPDVDQFDGLDYLQNSWVRRHIKEVNLDTVKVGIPRQERNYFWYKTEFELPAKEELVILKINKAQFGTVVYVNGKKAGHHLGCFTPGIFDITSLVSGKKKNALVIRIGAHPGALPNWAPSGSDYEKPTWTPGIYDDVSIINTSYPYIDNIQVAPDIERSIVTIQSRIVNGDRDANLMLKYNVEGANFAAPEKEFSGQPVNVGARDTIMIRDTIDLSNVRLWTPENPNLYRLTVDAGSDNLDTRFGMREFHFDTKTKLAYLNGKPYYLRGSNITLHRFFDDDSCAALPWNEQWVRKLLSEWPNKFNWNSFRFCIGPVPNFWLDIADETGLIIQNEFFIWQYHHNWDSLELKNQVIDWMEDNWNHASVGWWDICNETDTEYLRDIIRDVRHMDLSKRAWDNGYGLPVGQNDPVEDHHYNIAWNGWKYTEYMNRVAPKTTNSPHPTAHAPVLNEYGWLWLRRDGSPTLLSKRVYDSIAPNATNKERIELAAYLLGMETEYFRAHRNYAGVLHFTFLTGNFENVITGDLFSDIRELSIHPAYEKYFVEIFKPLGLYINYSREIEERNKDLEVRVMMVNDEYRDLEGDLELRLVNSDGKSIETEKNKFLVQSLGAMTYNFHLKTPATPGLYWLEARSYSTDGREPTLSRRKLRIE